MMKPQNPGTKSQGIVSSEWWEAEPSDKEMALHEEPANTTGNKHPFDLEERTARFGEAIVRFTKKIPRDPSNNRLIDQLVGCGTSVGANYCEADERVSKKDFRFTIRKRASCIGKPRNCI